MMRSPRHTRLEAFIFMLPTHQRVTGGDRQDTAARWATVVGLPKVNGWYRYPRLGDAIAQGDRALWQTLEAIGYARREEGGGMTDTGELSLPTFVVGPAVLRGASAATNVASTEPGFVGWNHWDV